MGGLFLAILYVAYCLIFGDGTMSGPDAFLSGATFLFWWYVAVTALVSVCMVALSLLVPAATMAAWSREGGRRGAVAGLLLGGALSTLLLLAFVIRSFMLIGGAYLLMTSGEYGMAWADFSTVKLIVGGLLLLMALVKFRRSQKKD